jgi:class 3 adenylate cyclase
MWLMFSGARGRKLGAMGTTRPHLAAAESGIRTSGGNVQRFEDREVELPQGTVTFLLTDVEGSTRLWEQDREAMRAAVVRYDAIVAAIVHAGRNWRRPPPAAASPPTGSAGRRPTLLSLPSACLENTHHALLGLLVPNPEGVPGFAARAGRRSRLTIWVGRRRVTVAFADLVGYSTLGRW